MLQVCQGKFAKHKYPPYPPSLRKEREICLSRILTLLLNKIKRFLQLQNVYHVVCDLVTIVFTSISTNSHFWQLNFKISCVLLHESKLPDQTRNKLISCSRMNARMQHTKARCKNLKRNYLSVMIIDLNGNNERMTWSFSGNPFQLIEMLLGFLVIEHSYRT